MNGRKLDAVVAAAAKMDGPSGFFLASLKTDAEYFALRRRRGAVIRYELTAMALMQLTSAGAAVRPIPRSTNSPGFQGNELHVPPQAFAMFNELRRAGEIVVSP